MSDIVPEPAEQRLDDAHRLALEEAWRGATVRGNFAPRGLGDG
jgi:hypothetical protein